MYRVALINMPFANLSMPSIALTQLKSMLDKNYPAAVEVRVLDLHLDFVDMFGFDDYNKITHVTSTSGAGDWVFRSSAFPEQPDNAEAYFRRYFPQKTGESLAMRQLLLQARPKIDGFLEGLIDRYRLDEYDLVGLTTMFSQSVACFAMARRIKQRNPKVIIAMGGSNCESPMGQEIVRHVEAVDFVFSGPSLGSFPSFVGHCLEGSPERGTEQAGVFSKNNVDGKLEGDLFGKEIDLDELGPLNYDAFLDKVEAKFPDNQLRVALPFQTSRGCWWGERSHCTFCGENGTTMAFKAMGPQRAVEVISSLFKYESRVEMLQGVDTILSRQYIEAVMPHLETPPSMNILYETKAAFSEAELQILSKARVNYIQPGIEALDSSLLKLMRKGSTSFNNIRLLMNCRKHRIHPMWNLLVGFPGEDPGLYAAYQRNLPKMAHLPPPTGVYTVRFDRFSPYFNKAQEYDLDLQPMPFYELAYPFPKESLKNLAYFFVNSNYNLEYLGPLSHHIAPLEGLVRTWRSLWDSRDAKRPMLYQEVVGDETVIYDSRFSEERRYAISGAATGILKALARPKTLQDLSIIMDELSAEELEREMDFLKVNDLLFEEKGYWMNLVFDQHPMDEDDPAFAKAPH